MQLLGVDIPMLADGAVAGHRVAHDLSVDSGGCHRGVFSAHQLPRQRGHQWPRTLVSTAASAQAPALVPTLAFTPAFTPAPATVATATAVRTPEPRPTLAPPHRHPLPTATIAVSVTASSKRYIFMANAMAQIGRRHKHVGVRKRPRPGNRRCHHLSERQHPQLCQAQENARANAQTILRSWVRGGDVSPGRAQRRWSQLKFVARQILGP